MKTIYDEAIESLTTPIVHDTIYGVYEGYMLSEEERGVVFKALERAKKVEKELEEYKISDKSKEESSIEYYNLYKETKRKLKKVEDLLGLYRKAHPRVSVFNPYYDELVKKEKELEEMK